MATQDEYTRKNMAGTIAVIVAQGFNKRGPVQSKVTVPFIRLLEGEDNCVERTVIFLVSAQRRPID